MNSMSKTTALPGSVATHADISSKHQSLEKNIGGYKPADATSALIQALRYFEDNTRTEREQLLLSTHIKTKPELAASAWLSHCSFAGSYGRARRASAPASPRIRFSTTRIAPRLFEWWQLRAEPLR